MGFPKRLMGFEPTTFCMASRRSSQLSYSRKGPDDSRRQTSANRAAAASQLTTLKNASM
jgi:hypothetical protein